VPDDLAVVRLDATEAEGDLGGMSTAIVAMRAQVYRARPQAGAVIHTHSRICWRCPEPVPVPASAPVPASQTAELARYVRLTRPAEVRGGGSRLDRGVRA
jgi:hypothetical protein